MRNFSVLLTAPVLLMGLIACNERPGAQPETDTTTAKSDTLQFTVEAAPEWTSLFKREHGWFGGDGIFSVTRAGVEKEGEALKDEAMIWFSDTMFGDIMNDSLQPGYGMINNSVALLHGGRPDSSAIRFCWDSSNNGKPKSLFIPSTAATGKTDYYWLGDGFINQEKNNDLYIFGYRIKNIPKVALFGFSEEGNTLMVVPAGARPPFKEQRQLDIPFYLGKRVDSTGSFGAAVLVNTAAAGAVSPDGYLYVYGVRGQAKEVLVARMKPADIETFSLWRFWNGSDWTANINEIKPITDGASNEMSVTALPDGRYVMVFQKNGVGNMVGLRVGTSPYGPFGPIQDVYDVSADLTDSKQFFAYNAKAHPVLSAPGELLISYNINSFDFDREIRLFPNLYRPRFIRLKYKTD